MINFLELDKHILNISESIITKFSPNIDSLYLKKEIESYGLTNNLILSSNEYDVLMNGVKAKLKNHIKYRIDKGSLPKFEFSVTDSDYLVGIANAKPIYSSFSDYYYYLDKISDKDFEIFSAKYIKELFCDFSFVTRTSSDGGIDFIGNGTFTKLLNVTMTPINLKSKNLHFKIIGQSKRYSISNKISTKEIREFIGSAKILQDSINPYKENSWLGEKDVLKKMKFAEPFVLLFITTSYYSRDSIKLAKKLGIYIYDIDDIIFDLIDNSIGLENNLFNSVKFEKWYK